MAAEQELSLPRRNQLDLRLTKGVPLGDQLRFEGSVDIYNIFNANDVMQVNSTFGGAWIRPLRNAYAGGATVAAGLRPAEFLTKLPGQALDGRPPRPLLSHD